MLSVVTLTTLSDVIICINHQEGVGASAVGDVTGRGQLESTTDQLPDHTTTTALLCDNSTSKNTNDDTHDNTNDNTHDNTIR